jgi:ankyrin repeat protein
VIDLVIARSTHPDADASAVLKWAKEHGLGQIVSELLQDQVKQSNSNPVMFLLDWTVKKNCVPLLKMLLADKRIDPSAHNQQAIREASENGHAEMVKLLLADKRVNPSADDQYAIGQASANGYVDVVKLLLADQRVDPSADNQYAIGSASANGHAHVVKLLLADKRVDPSVDDQYTIRWASAKGHADVVKVLLADQRVDPSKAIRLVCNMGRAEVMKLLLADQRVDPSADDQYAIGEASANGHTEVVKLLLADQRVDPSADNHYAIRWASAYGHADVVKVLLSDQRVDISGLPDSYSPQVLALFSLRRSYRLELERKQQSPNSVSALCSVLADLKRVESQRKALLDDHLVSDLSNLCLEYVPDFFCHFDGKVSSLVDSNSDSDNKFPRFSFGNLSTL